MRPSDRLLRPVTWTVLVTFITGCLQPLSVLAKDGDELRQQMAQAAAAEAKRNPLLGRQLGLAPRGPGSGAESRAAARLAQAQQALKELAPEASRDERTFSANRRERARRADDLIRPQGAGRSQRVTALRHTLNDIRAERRAMRRSFDDVHAELIQRGVNAEILGRHHQAVAEFESRADEFERLAERLGRAGAGEEQSALDDLARFFQRHPAGKPHTPTDPDNLPWGSPRRVKRPPPETVAELKRELFGEPVRLASAAPARTLGLNAGAILAAQAASTAPTAADLGETDDITLTPAIRAKAQELGHNPVQISNWVRNHIEWIPSWGSIQGAELTLQTRRGNAIDTASLTLALLRAAGIPARYVIGTIEVDAEKLNNWVGGTEKIEAAISLLGQGGIASTALVAGGRIVKVWMQHAWVQAYVNWVPARGARNYSAGQHQNANPALNAWVDIDTSFKQYAATPGMNLAAAVPLDADALLAGVTQGATVNEAQGYVQHLNAANLQDQLAAYQARVQSYINATKPEATVGDVLGTRRIVPDSPAMLAGSLPYATKLANGTTVRGEFASLPDSVKWTVDIGLYDRTSGTALLTRALPLAAVAGKRIGLIYEPATEADRQLLEAAADQYQTTFVAYLIKMVPRLRLEDTVLAEAAATTPGTDHELTVTLNGTEGSDRRSYRLVAGTSAVLVVNPNGLPLASWEARMSAKDLMQPTNQPPDLYRFVEEMLHQIGLAWWAMKDAYEQMAAAQQGIVRFNMPSHALVEAPLIAEYYFGIPRSAGYRSRAIDSQLDRLAAEHRGNDGELRRGFLKTAGVIGSYLEGAVFELAFLAEHPYGVSTISLLAAANAQGRRVYSLDASRAATVNQLATSTEVKVDIVNALNAGLRVTVPEGDVTHFAYTGIGYIVEDPETGAAAYLIDGGMNGGSAPTPENVYPMPLPPGNAAILLVVGSALRSAGLVAVISPGGQVLGVALGATASALAPPALLLVLMAAIGAFVIWSSASAAIEESYPRTSRVFRHYSHALWTLAISTTRFLVGSRAGDLGPGVYFEEQPRDNTLGANCPVSGEQSVLLVAKYNLPSSNSPIDLGPWGSVLSTPFTRAASWIEIEVTRDKYWDAVVFRGPNRDGTPETVFRLPFLYFGLGAVAVRQNDLCY
jgi:hypothetical protein